MAKYDEMTSIKNPGRPVQVESAKRDGSGKNIENNYAKQNGSYMTLDAGNLLPTADNAVANRFDLQTTCETGSTLDGVATVKEIRGFTTWSNNTPVGASITSLTAVGVNLYNKQVGYAICATTGTYKSYNGTPYRISGTGISTSTVVKVGTTTCPITEVTWTGGSQTFTYFQFIVPSGHKGEHITVEDAPEDCMIMLVWSGYNTGMAFREYEENTLTFGSNITAISLHSLTVGNATVYDYINLATTTSTKVLYRNLTTFAFNGSRTFTAGATSSGYYPYTLTVSTALKNGIAQIGSTNPITFNKDLTSISGECFGISANNTVQFWLSYDHAKTFDTATESGDYDSSVTYHYLNSSNVFTALTITSQAEFDEALATYTTLYYNIAENGADYLNELLDGYTLLAERTHTGNTINVTAQQAAMVYSEWDFGLEIANYPTGFNYPVLLIGYPIDIKHSVQTLSENYVSLESVKNLLHQVGNQEGFDFNDISVTDGIMNLDGLVNTKETIVDLDIAIEYSPKQYSISEDVRKKLYYYAQRPSLWKHLTIKYQAYYDRDNPSPSRMYQNCNTKILCALNNGMIITIAVITLYGFYILKGQINSENAKFISTRIF